MVYMGTCWYIGDNCCVCFVITKVLWWSSDSFVITWEPDWLIYWAFPFDCEGLRQLQNCFSTDKEDLWDLTLVHCCNECSVSAGLLWCIHICSLRSRYVRTYVHTHDNLSVLCTLQHTNLSTDASSVAPWRTVYSTYVPDGLHPYLPSVLHDELLQPWLFLMWECCRHAGRGLAGCTLLPQSALFDLCSHCFHLPLLLTVQFVHECLAVLVSRGVNGEGVPIHLRTYVRTCICACENCQCCKLLYSMYIYIHICMYMYCIHCISTC